jgi:hypothetical protein
VAIGVGIAFESAIGVGIAVTAPTARRINTEKFMADDDMLVHILGDCDESRLMPY